MNKATLAAIYLLVKYTYIMIIIAGCAYIVFWLDHSAWWFLAAFFLTQLF